MYVLIQMNRVDRCRIRTLPVFFTSREEATNHASHLNSSNAYRGTVFQFSVGEGAGEEVIRAEQSLPRTSSTPVPLRRV